MLVTTKPTVPSTLQLTYISNGRALFALVNSCSLNISFCWYIMDVSLQDSPPCNRQSLRSCCRGNLYFPLGHGYVDTSNMTTSIPMMTFFFPGDFKTWQKGSLKNWSTAIHWPRLRALQLTWVPHLVALPMSTERNRKIWHSWQEPKSAKGKEVKCETQRVSYLFWGVWKTWTFVICDIFSVRSFSNKEKGKLLSGWIMLMNIIFG